MATPDRREIADSGADQRGTKQQQDQRRRGVDEQQVEVHRLGVLEHDDQEQGDGTETDLRLARYWYDIAARNGDAAAPYKLQALQALELRAITAPP